MSKIFAFVLMVLVSVSSFASKIGDCVETPSRMEKTGYLTATKVILLKDQPNGRTIRQLDFRPAMVVKKVNGYVLLANVPDDSENEKACYNLGWAKDGDPSQTHMRNCSNYDNLCNGGD